MIPKDVIDRIYSSAKIEDVVGDYVSLKRRGASLWGLCPFPGHTEKTPSFSVNPARNICKCFGCGQGGNAINFVMAMEQCSYPEALKIVAKKYHIEVPEREMTEEEQQRHDDRESMFVVNDWANKWYQDQLWNTQDGQAIALAYFHQRGLRDETIRRFQLGFSPVKGYVLPKAAKEAGYKEAYLLCNPETGIGTGICNRSSQKDDRQPSLYDRYHGRVIFPIHGISGKTVGFAGRILEKRDDVGKYVNSPESLVYSKKRELYGFFLAKSAIIKNKKCYLVEGQMDCISMSQAGIENVVCSGGTALTVEQIQTLHRFTENVTILYDGDAAGIHAALRGIDMFLDEGINIKVMLFPDGDDPDSFARKHTDQEFIEYINAHEEDFIRYKTRTLLAGTNGDTRLLAEAVKSIALSISFIKDRITREVYIKECAREFEMREEVILKEVNTIIRKRIDERNGKNSSPSEPSDPTGEQPQTQVSQKPQPVILSESESILDQNFKNLLRLLVVYGERPMIFLNPDGSHTTIKVGDYIQQYLAATQISNPKPLYDKFFSEFNLHKEEPDFKASTLFFNHSDLSISSLATDLVSSVYGDDTPEDINQVQLIDLVSHLLYELHYVVVEQKLDEVDHQIEEASRNNDTQALLNAMALQPQLLELKQTIAGLLGKC